MKKIPGSDVFTNEFSNIYRRNNITLMKIFLKEKERLFSNSYYEDNMIMQNLARISQIKLEIKLTHKYRKISKSNTLIYRKDNT